MLKYNALRFGTDTFQMNRQGLLTAKTPLDATTVTSVTGFTISGEQPENTERRIAFKIDGELKKFSGSDLVRLSGDETFDNIIQNGNTVAELLALTNIPAFVGQKIYPIIALSASDSAEEMPTIKLALNGVTNSQQLTKTVETAELSLSDSDAVPIVSITANTTCTASGAINVSVALLNGSEWGDFMPIADAADQSANAVKFKIVYSVDEVGNEHSAKLNSIIIRTSQGQTVVTGADADFYSTVQNYEEDLQTCYLVVRHKTLFDSMLSAFVTFGTAPKKRTLIAIGTGNGSSTLYDLPDTGIHPSTMNIFVNGVAVADFGYSTNTNKVRVTAPADAAITASYEYDWQPEVWHEMTKEIDQQLYPDGNRMTRFAYSLDDEQTANMQISAVRVVMSRPSGSIVNQSLGTATGKTQQVVLSHAAVQSSIQMNAQWSYNPDDKILTFVAAKGTAIKISYDWLGEQITVYSWAAGWNAAI